MAVMTVYSVITELTDITNAARRDETWEGKNE
jgi:hypothetical protein